MGEDRKCFIMQSLKSTQQEAIDRKLFGEVERSFELIKGLKPGDIGFLFNIDTNTLIGSFEAASEAGHNLEPEAWKGKYPAQIRVKFQARLLKQINNANKVLQGMGIEFDELRLGKLQPRLPVHGSVIMKTLTKYVSENGSPFSETRAEPVVNETGNELIELYASELPDSYLRVLNEVAVETQQETFEKLPTTLPSGLKLGDRRLDIPKPFNICVLGEVTNESQIRMDLGKHFQKKSVSERDWDIEFYNNRKIEQGILASLKRGHSNFNLIVTGQIHNHAIRGAKTANIFTELSKGHYVDHIQGSDPEKLLTADMTIDAVDKYLKQFQH